MRVEKVKKVTEIHLDGITVEGVMEANEIRELNLCDTNGNRVLFRLGRYGGFEVFVPAPPKLVRVFTLSGMVAGLSVHERFSDELDANRRKDELVELRPLRDNEGLKVEPSEVNEDEAPVKEIPF